jgi:acyl-CoA thioesterase-1
LSFRFLPYAGPLLLLQGLAACSDQNNPAVATNDAVPAAPEAARPADRVAEGKLVLAFGDSLYAGYGVAPQDSFPSELERALRARGVKATVRNAGVSGDTSAAGLRRLDFALDGLPRRPDLVLVNLGGNDMLRGVDPAETRRNLAAICGALQRRGIPILLTGMVAAPNLGREFADRFNAIYPDLAKRFHAGLYPFFLDGVVTRPDLMQPDRIHPTAQGIDIIAARVAPLVAERLAATGGA